MMEITEVRIKLMEDSEDRLRAFCSITIDNCFVVRDLKIIEGASGPFVAMPSRKLTSRCHRCGHKNYLRTAFCSHCGVKLRASQEVREEEGPANKLYADIAHPINQTCRDLIQKAVLQEYQLELERAKLPGYRSRYDEAYVDGCEASSGTVSVDSLDGLSPKRPHILDPNSKLVSGGKVSEVTKSSTDESPESES
jgi:stage V sporulation protein G